MAISLWFAIRQAREALRVNQPELARRLLEPYVREGYRKAIVEFGKISLAYLDRAEKAYAAGNVEAAWNDLLAAESLGTGAPAAATLRQRLTAHGLASMKAALVAGIPSAALDAIAHLRERVVASAELDWAEESALAWAQAVELADRGEFAAATASAERAKALLPAELAAGIHAYLGQLESHFQRFTPLVETLQAAVQAADWGEVMRRADEVLRLAPGQREARALRARAWNEMVPGSTVSNRPRHAANGNEAEAPLELKPVEEAPRSPPVPKRFLLWIDGVGGYLVCLAPRITLGQATAHGPVDIPLYADVSRLHAEITRDGEGYVIESSRGVSVNGTPTTRTTLRHGDRVTLGATCQFIFNMPVPISPTARLDLVSGHRLPLAVDGVLLMAETMILGPPAQAHVPMPDSDNKVILYRSKDGLGLRYAGSFRVDNQPCQDRAALPIPCLVTAEAFSFALEAVGPRV